MRSVTHGTFTLILSILNLTHVIHRPKRQRTTAEARKRAKYKQPFNDNRTISDYKQKDISKYMDKKVAAARVNYHTFEDFDYSRSLKYRPNPIPTQATSWSGGIARSAISNDGINLAFYLPNTFTTDWTARTTEWLIDFGNHKMKPHFKEAGSSVEDYIHRPGELSGGIAPVRGWHAIGSETVSKFNLHNEDRAKPPRLSEPVQVQSREGRSQNRGSV